MAHWIIEDYGFGGQVYTCSHCRHTWDSLFNDVSMLETCPNCGTPLNEDEAEYVEKMKKKQTYKPFEHFSLPVMTFDGVNIVDKIYVQMIDEEEKAIHDAIIKEGLAQGFNELFLIDKKFVFDAIREKIQREGLL